MRFEDLSIKTKLILMQISTCLIVLGLCCIAFVIADINSYKERKVESTRAIAQVIAVNSVSALKKNDQRAATDILSELKVQTDVLNAVLLDSTNKPVATYTKQGKSPHTFSYEAGSSTSYEYKKENLFIYNDIIDENKKTIGAVCLRIDISQLDRLVEKKVSIAILLFILGVAIALIISLIIQRYISKPLLYLVEIMNEIKTSRNYSKRSALKGKDEISGLSNVFNRMLDEIEKKDTELELRFSEQEAFSYSVSHDLKAPLRAINGFAQIIDNRYKETLNPDSRELFQMIATNARKMGRLIEDLLVFSRLGRSEIKKETIQMNMMVESVVQEARSLEPNRKVTINIGELQPAKGDINMVRQVWRNLIFNAWKYTGHSNDPIINIGCLKENDEIIYFIKDNGVGFDMKYENKLFGVFQRLHTDEEFEGTGIGLAIVKKIVERHNGRVWVDAELNQGATFYFTLN